MISLAFHHDRIVAATISEGGDFVLTSSCYFVVVSFNYQTHFFHNQTHCATDVVC